MLCGCVVIGCCCRTLSLKAVRRLLEQDLGLNKKRLDAQKDLIGVLVDKVCKLCDGCAVSISVVAVTVAQHSSTPAQGLTPPCCC